MKESSQLNNDALKKICEEGIKIHTKKLLTASESYDKSILTLAVASLGYVFAFVKIGNNSPYSCLQSCSFIFLMLSFFSVLISFIVDQCHCKHRIRYFECYITGVSEKPSDRYKKHWSDKLLCILPILSGIFLFIGILLFGLLVIYA